MSRGQLQLLAGLAVAGFAAGALLGPSTPLRAVVAGAILLLPGGLLVAALLPQRPADLATRLMLSLGASLALLVALGLLLNAVGLGLDLLTWALGVLGVGAVAALVAARRRTSLSLEGGGPGLAGVAMLTMACLLAVGAVALADRGQQATTAASITQLWLVPDASGGAELGVRNLEGHRTGYRVTLLLDGTRRGEWDLEPLADGETWQVLLGADALDFAERAEVRLSRAASDEIYRRVFLDVRDGAAAAAGEGG